MSAETKIKSLRRRYLELSRLRGNPDPNWATEDAQLDTSLTYKELVHMVAQLETLLAIKTLNHMDLREWAENATVTTAKILIQRDAARRWLCAVLARPEFVTGLAKPGDGTKYAFAKEQGWDCFEEPTL
jgi:hypothetical protein